jgi:hypothetical protein
MAAESPEPLDDAPQRRWLTWLAGILLSDVRFALDLLNAAQKRNRAGTSAIMFLRQGSIKNAA